MQILAAGEDPQGYDLFLPPMFEIFWSAVFIAIFGLVFARYVLPRLNAVLDERRERIEGGIERAEQVQAEADRMKADQESRLAEARQEAAKIREKAREDAVRIVEEAKSAAAVESDRVLAAGRAQLAAERQSASTQLRSEVGTLASDLASKIVGESLSDDARSERVIDRFLADLEASQTSAR
ncbi:MAG: F0F1 ATP synthase subunit B [Brachybacterium sp.]|nr:F0F1 ATP synthase subunit B [Brachybacterium sp.]